MSNGSGEDSFTRKYIIWPWGIWPWPQGQGHMKCCLVPATSCDLCAGKIWSCYFQNIMRRCVFKKIHYLTIDLDLGVKVTQNIAQYPLHHVTYTRAKFEVATSKSLWGDAFTRKYIIRPLTLTLGSRSHEMSPSTLYIMWSMHLQSFKLLRPTVLEKIQLQGTWRMDGQLDRQTDRCTDGRTTDRLWYEINIPYFSYEKAGIIIIITISAESCSRECTTLATAHHIYAIYIVLQFS